MIKNLDPLPLIYEFLDWLGCAKWFTQLELNDAYYQRRISEDDKCKTKFSTRYDQFEY